MKLNHLGRILLFIFALTNNAWAAPQFTTYQAKIIKPDGYPLESNNVNFKFTILNPAGTCILYSEIYNAISMSGSSGLINFSLGSGIKSFPVSSTTFADVFNNASPSLTCAVGGPVDYQPASTDNRKIVMQFNDGNGWQTLPAMAINAVPYAMYADDSLKLGGVSATSYVKYSTIPTCSASQALQYNGVNFSCATMASGGDPVTSSTVITALGYTPVNGASYTTLSSALSSTQGDVSTVSSTLYSVSSTVQGLSTSVGSLSASLAAITSSQWNTSGTTINYLNGNVGIGTIAPVTKLEVSGGVKISMESAACAISYAGTLRYNSGSVEFCNGTTWSAFGVSGAGLQSFNGSTSGTQTFANGIVGTAPAFVTANGVHTLNIPLATTGSVTAGLISNSDYVSFAGKITSSAASIAQVLGYVPASATALGNYLVKTNNLSDLASATVARTNLGLGSFATASTLDLGSASATGTLAEARLPSFANVTSGTQYTKVTVDGKGRVVSGAQLVFNDVTTALGYTPASASASTQWNTSGTTINYMAGKVGIGTAAPLTTLDIFGYSYMSGQPSNLDPGGGGNTIINTLSAGSNWGLLTGNNRSGGNQETNFINIASRGVSGYGGFSFSSMDYSGDAATNLKMLVYMDGKSGNVGVGTTNPNTNFHVSGTVKITGGSPGVGKFLTSDASGLASWATPSAVVASLNGSTSTTQTFANGTTGTAPAYVTANGIHTLNIPLASAGSVTAGLISNSDYVNFAGKITSSAASIAQVLGYVPASATALGNYLVKTNNLSDLASATVARTNLGLGSLATLNSVDLSSVQASGTLAIARTPAYTGDVTKAIASNTLVLSNTGVIAATYPKVTVDAKGRVTSGTQLVSSDVTTALGYTPAASGVVSSQWVTSGTIINYALGNVGIGTTTPTAQLTVSGTQYSEVVLSTPLATMDTGNNIGSNVRSFVRPSSDGGLPSAIYVGSQVYQSTEGGNAANMTNAAVIGSTVITNIDKNVNASYGSYNLVSQTAHSQESVASMHYVFTAATANVSSITGTRTVIDNKGISQNVIGGQYTVANETTANLATAKAIEGNVQNVLYGTGLDIVGVGASQTALGINIGSVSAQTAYGIYVNNVITGTNAWSIYSASTRPSYYAGKIGIGVSAPISALQVSGTITNTVSTYSTAFTCGSSTLNFVTGNFQRLSSSNAIAAGTCNVALSNLVAGGSYSLVVTGNSAVNAITYNFTGYTFKYLPINAATMAGKDTIYTFLYDGTTVYVTWSSGY